MKLKPRKALRAPVRVDLPVRRRGKKPFDIPDMMRRLQHRVTNRWGIIHATTPEKMGAALEAAPPQRYWTEINRLLVPFGKFICTAKQPKCSTCPLLEYCRQVGVTSHR